MAAPVATADPIALGVTAFSLLVVLALSLAALAGWERRAADADEEGIVSHRTRSVLVVVFVAAFVFVATLGAASGAYVVALPPLLFLLWAVRGVAENVACGVVLGLTRPFDIGDWVAWEDDAGEVVAIALTHVRLRRRDHSVLQIPHHTVLATTLRSVSPDAVDAPVEALLSLPPGLPPTQARELAVLCAATSPYASLRRRPETFVETEQGGGLALRVRGYVSDARHGETYRSHMIEAWHESTTEVGVPGTS